jgi:hypothetical protein
MAVKIKIPAADRFDYGSDRLPRFWSWCVEQFGQPHHTNWSINSYDELVFHNEEHAALFALKWL